MSMIARLFLWLTGWQVEGGRPAARRYVLIAAPHTSNWDLAYLLAFAALMDVKLSFLMKHTWFRGPLGPIMRSLGGVAIKREHRGNTVEQMASLLEKADTLALTVPAEGTRSYVAHWKSGFYHIASRAQVPIVLGFLDYERKRGGFGPEVIPTGDIAEDMDTIRSFYADKVGRHPELFGEIRLKEEMIT